jgi:UDP-glucose 6-dehydrogenase
MRILPGFAAGGAGAGGFCAPSDIAAFAMLLIDAGLSGSA